MGNTSSGVTSGGKNQAEGNKALYKFADLGGGGSLVALVKQAISTDDFTALDKSIREDLKQFLYNDGEGIDLSVNEIIAVRHKERTGNEFMQPTKNKRTAAGGRRSFDFATGRLKEFAGKIGLRKAAEDAADQEMSDGSRGRMNSNKGIVVTNNNNSIEEEEEEVGKRKRPQQVKRTCWLLDERGGVGETVLHVCFLCGSEHHMVLAKRLLAIYPRMIDDIYVSDEYYGENVLHMGIVNEDVMIVKYLIDQGVDLHQRACGNFFTADDQKPYRRDIWDDEIAGLSQKTRYTGHMYWGEYPLTFAACLNQESSYRILVAKGSDPNRQDTNGNTAAHIMEMFDLAVETGTRLDIQNRLGLTPLTLSAFLAKKDMFEHILEIEREVYWEYGGVVCGGYPLLGIDTIHPKTGRLNPNSALALLETVQHLECFNYVIEELCTLKWKEYAKRRMYMQLFKFILFYFIFFLAFYLRPTPSSGSQTSNTVNSVGQIMLDNNILTTPTPRISFTGPGNTSFGGSPTSESSPSFGWQNPAVEIGSSLDYKGHEDLPRTICEILVALGCVVYLMTAVKDYHYVGKRLYLQGLIGFPARAAFLISCILVILMVPLRIGGQENAENVIGIVAILLAASRFLFFCRGFKLLAPFVLTIYRIVMRDLFNFFLIYLIFVAGFSQSFYIIFRGYRRGDGTGYSADVNGTIVNSIFESFNRMFIMSLNEFGVFYENLNSCTLATLGKIMFCLYILLVSILLINMLIAMMTNTYTGINESEEEKVRQWAAMILMMEQSLSPHTRLQCQSNYSSAMASKPEARAIVIRHRISEEKIAEQKEEQKEAQKMFTLDRNADRVKRTAATREHSALLSIVGRGGQDADITVNRGASGFNVESRGEIGGAGGDFGVVGSGGKQRRLSQAAIHAFADMSPF